MIVVSDAGPLRYLVPLGVAEVLPRLFGQVVCPNGVVDECLAEAAPEPLRAFASEPPSWLVLTEAGAIDSRVGVLDRGESEAITIALRLNARLLLIDEKKGRRMASALGFEFAGTLAVLAAAGKRGWVDYQEVTNRLISQTKFRVTAETIRAAWDNA